MTAQAVHSGSEIDDSVATAIFSQVLDVPEFYPWLRNKGIENVMLEIMESEPRHAVMMASALIEQELKDILENSTVEIPGYRKFQKASYIEALAWAFRLGIIDKAFLKELQLLDKIHSCFVSDWSRYVDFESREVDAYVTELRSVIRFFKCDIGSPRPIWSKPLFNWVLTHSNREWWELSVGALLGELIERGEKVVRPEPEQNSWKRLRRN